MICALQTSWLLLVLPCFFQIIYKINTIFLEEVKSKFGNDYDRLARMSIVDDGEKKACFNPLPPHWAAQINSFQPVLGST